MTSTSIKFPVFSLRLRAYLIDLLFLTFLVYLSAFIVSLLGDISGAVKGVIFVAIIVLFEPILVSFSGGNIGHHCLGIRVVDAKTHKNINFFKALIRTFLKILCGVFSFLFMFVNRKHRVLHDVLSGSVVAFKNADDALEWRIRKPRERYVEGEKASLLRRLLVFVLLSTMAYLIIGWLSLMLVSNNCLNNRLCVDMDGVWLIVLYASLVVTCIVFFVKAIKGTLYGTNFK